jgi:nitrite reductase/ring-hydroxylating ferredoxin subunit
MQLDHEAPMPSRRSVLDGLLGLGILGWLASIVYPVLRYLRPLAAQDGSGPRRLTREEAAKLDQERTLIVRHGPTRILVFEDPEQRLRALEARCTHEGCTVQYVPGDSLIWCACHNGRFDLDGRVLSGPPPRPLARWTAQRDADGSVSVAPTPPAERA